MVSLYGTTATTARELLAIFNRVEDIYTFFPEIFVSALWLSLPDFEKLIMKEQKSLLGRENFRERKRGGAHNISLLFVSIR